MLVSLDLQFLSQIFLLGLSLVIDWAIPTPLFILEPTKSLICSVFWTLSCWKVSSHPRRLGGWRQILLMNVPVHGCIHCLFDSLGSVGSMRRETAQITKLPPLNFTVSVFRVIRGAISHYTPHWSPAFSKRSAANKLQPFSSVIQSFWVWLETRGWAIWHKISRPALSQRECLCFVTC